MLESENVELETRRERSSDIRIDINGVFNMKDSGIGDSFLLGSDIYDLANSKTFANAYVNGILACPENITVPGKLTDLNGETMPVEIIGNGAYTWCGSKDRNGNTKRFIVARQVKIIKTHGISGMFDLESFEIEAGSVLEMVEEYGIAAIGLNTGQISGKRTEVLILPSTLSLVYEDGIVNCNIIHTFYYCGSHLLSNSSDLENSYMPNETVVKVTDQYPSGENIFGRSPDRESQDEVQEKCKGYMYDSGFKTELFGSESGVIVTGWGNYTDTWCPDSFSIPERIKGLPVLAINESAFENCTTGGAIVLPQTLRKIGAKAFAFTVNVTGISLPTTNSLEEIGERAFWRCGVNSSKGFRLALLSSEKLTIHDEAFGEANVEDFIFV